MGSFLLLNFIVFIFFLGFPQRWLPGIPQWQLHAIDFLLCICQITKKVRCWEKEPRNQEPRRKSTGMEPNAQGYLCVCLGLTLPSTIIYLGTKTALTCTYIRNRGLHRMSVKSPSLSSFYAWEHCGSKRERNSPKAMVQKCENKVWMLASVKPCLLNQVKVQEPPMGSSSARSMLSSVSACCVRGA